MRLKQLRRIITLDSIRETFSLWTDSDEKWYQTVKRENYIFFAHFSQLNPSSELWITSKALQTQLLGFVSAYRRLTMRTQYKGLRVRGHGQRSPFRTITSQPNLHLHNNWERKKQKKQQQHGAFPCVWTKCCRETLKSNTGQSHIPLYRH